MTTLDELEAIRARHWVAGQYVTLALDAGQQAHADRATLLRLLDAERARADKAEAELAALRALCLPVLEEIKQWSDDTPDDWRPYIGGEPQPEDTTEATYTLGDLRRLARALKGPTT